MNKFAPLSPKVNALLHGADYNPEQWENYPGIIDQDIAMMQQAKCNVMSVGIFSWAKLEPQEGVFEFGWLDSILDKLYAAGIHVFLATPSGARPAWMSQAYPQVLRVGRDRVPALHGGRHNHCMTSPVYREKIFKINSRCNISGPGQIIGINRHFTDISDQDSLQILVTDIRCNNLISTGNCIIIIFHLAETDLSVTHQ